MEKQLPPAPPPHCTPPPPHRRVAERAGRALAQLPVAVGRQVADDGREGEDVAAGRDLGALRRPHILQGDGAAHRLAGQQLHLRIAMKREGGASAGSAGRGRHTTAPVHKMRRSPQPDSHVHTPTNSPSTPDPPPLTPHLHHPPPTPLPPTHPPTHTHPPPAPHPPSPALCRGRLRSAAHRGSSRTPGSGSWPAAQCSAAGGGGGGGGVQQ